MNCPGTAANSIGMLKKLTSLIKEKEEAYKKTSFWAPGRETFSAVILNSTRCLYWVINTITTYTGVKVEPPHLMHTSHSCSKCFREHREVTQLKWESQGLLWLQNRLCSTEVLKHNDKQFRLLLKCTSTLTHFQLWHEQKATNTLDMKLGCH